MCDVIRRENGDQLGDAYLTIAAESHGVYKDRSSRFLAFAYPVQSAAQVRELVGMLRAEYYDARHCCYAYRLGVGGLDFRAVDDGEPSSTAGRPILGQLLSRDLTDVLVVVVRYFGGTKLGVGGLIEAYGSAAAEALDAAVVESRTVDVRFSVIFGYMTMNDVMRRVKDYSGVVSVEDQQFDNRCVMRLRVRQGLWDEVRARFLGVEGVEVVSE